MPICPARSRAVVHDRQAPARQRLDVALRVLEPGADAGAGVDDRPRAVLIPRGAAQLLLLEPSGLGLGAAGLARLPAALALLGQGLLGVLDLGLLLPQFGQLGLDAGALGRFLGRVRRDRLARRPEAEGPHPLHHGELVRLLGDLVIEPGFLVVFHGTASPSARGGQRRLTNHLRTRPDNWSGRSAHPRPADCGAIDTAAGWVEGRP